MLDMAADYAFQNFPGENRETGLMFTDTVSFRGNILQRKLFWQEPAVWGLSGRLLYISDCCAIPFTNQFGACA